MDLLDLLKKLKSIEPDKEFSLNSRNLILNTPPKVRVSFLGILLKNLELGAALALAGLLIFLTIGGFSAWKFFSPLELANFDATSIRAEAQAIDIQIKLANLNYIESTSTLVGGESTKMAASGPGNGTSPAGGALGGEKNNGNSSSSISIDEVLEKLSQ
jgi:hypothetical protein